MDRLISLIITFSRFATGTAFAVLMAAVLLQIAGRLTGDSPVWTEELTRFALLFLAAFGAGLSYRSGDLVNVDLVSESLPGKWPRRLRLLSAVTTALLCLVLIPPAWKYTSIGAMQTSPALTWRMDFIHASVLVLLASLAVFSIVRTIEMLLGRSEGLPPNPADDVA
ncbi:TRAP transporter small permease [Roseibium salinum]|uniref:TRAP transporter small permease protein n=1 Tax=Roseibium salinum TaxID=1604349 RepID=A0ABT3QX80_9HYPH|nr:TRAP transporter small permease [Roseibium sp. DSM 29163]MCX2721536.1 TRAP transporter small permease [Roseibium sp. DSM 29163]MDN3722008.1 TRAP transporter small permease [Roseibium salinum]